MRAVSESVYPVAISTPFAIVADGWLQHKPATLRNGIRSGIAVAAAASFNYLVKVSVDRERPYVTYPGLVKARSSTGGPYSFASGHTTAAFATAMCVTLTYRKWYAVAPAYAYAALVGYSRMRLGVHYPSDVVGGMIIGSGFGWLTWYVDRRIQLQHARKKAAPFPDHAE